MAQQPIQKYQVGLDIPVKRNAIINGDFNIWQRRTIHTGIMTPINYTADRWFLSVINQGTWTVQQIADGPTSQFQKCAECIVTTADAPPNPGDIVVFIQAIEGFNILPLYQVPFTISFWVKSNITGPYYLSVDNLNDRSYVIPYTISAANVWEYKTLSVTTAPIGGTWNFTNGPGLQFQWNLAAGSNFHTTTFNAWFTDVGTLSNTGSNQVNVAATINNYWRITGVQIEPGLTATPFEIRPFNEEVALCQRYYAKSYNLNVDPGTTSAGGNVDVTSASASLGGVASYVQFPMAMRVLPTITLYNPLTGAIGSWVRYGSDNASITGFAGSGGENAFRVFAAVSTDAIAHAIHWTADAEF